MFKGFSNAILAVFFASFLTISTPLQAHADGQALPVAASLGEAVVLDPTDGIDWSTGQALIPSWSWETRPGTSVADFSDTSALRPSFTPDVSGSWVARLDLFDAADPSVLVTSVLLDISTENTAPVAQITARGVSGGASPLTLDGTASYDIEGDPLSYAWTLVSAPSGHAATFSAADAPLTEFDYDVAGSYVVGLTVQDAAGLSSDVATFQIDVAGASDFDVEATLSTFNLVTNQYSGNQEVEGRTYIGSTVQGVTGQFGYDPAQDGADFAELYIDGNLQNATINLTPGDEARISGTASNANVNNGTLVENATDLPAFDFQVFRDQSAFLASLTGEPADLSDQNNKRLGGAANAIASEALFGPNTRIVEVTLQDLQTGGYSVDLSQVDTVIINVSGTSGTFQMNPLGGTGFAGNVLWNFYEATNINVNAVIAGHVLAPYARMTGFAGSSEGTVIADEVQLTNGELHQQPWLGQVPASAGQNGEARAVAPVADATFDQLVADVGQTILIDAFASTDIDGGPLSSTLEILSSPTGSTASLVTDANGVASFTGDVPGDYLVGLSVSDGARVGQDQVLVTVGGNARSQARIADLRDAAVGAVSTLDGTQSFDLDGDLLSYRWALLSVPATSTATLGAASSPEATLTPDVAGLYVVQLTVNDGTADGVPVTRPIVVGAPLPVADAGRDALPDANGEALLDATLSNGSGLTFDWSLLGLTGVGGNLDDAAIVTPRLTLPSLSEEMRVAIRTQTVFQINRSDLGGLCTYDTRLPADIPNPASSGWHGIAFWANGVVNDGSNRPVWVIDNQRDFTRTVELIDTAGVSRGTFTIPGRVRAYVTTDPLPGGAQIRVVLDGNQIHQRSPATYNFNQTDPTCSGAGTELAQLIVSDANGISLPETVFVGDTNLRPVMTRAAALTVTSGSPVTLTAPALAFDANGDPLSYAWSLIYRPAGSTATIDTDPSVTKVSGESLEFTGDRPGLYLVQLEASDGAFDALPVVIAVEVINSPPVASALSLADTFVGDTATLDGSASFDPDGDALTYNWTILSAPAGATATIPDPFGPIATFTPDRRGDFVFQLEVADYEFSDTVQVTLTAPNRAPVAVLDGPTEIAPGQTEIFSALASSDPDGDALEFTFSVDGAPPSANPILIDVATGEVSFTADVAGTYELSVLVSDGIEAATNSIAITVAAENEPPVLGDINDLYTVELGLELVLDLTATDPDGTPLSFFATPLPLPRWCDPRRRDWPGAVPARSRPDWNIRNHSRCL